MRINQLQILLLAALVGVPQAVFGAPCTFQISYCLRLKNDLHNLGPDGACSTKSLVLRKADPGIPIIPKPVVPKPIVPKPIVPQPVVPKPKPEPGPQAPGLTCKRAAGSVCTGIPAFSTKNLDIDRAIVERVDGFKNNGVVRQEALVAAQRAQSPTDINMPARDVANTYEVQKDATVAPLSGDEIDWFTAEGLNVPGFHPDSTWVRSQTKPKAENIPEGRLDNGILSTVSNPKDRVMVIEDSRGKENDLLPGKPGQDKPSWSDMAMHDWRSACTSADPAVSPDTLQYVVRSNLLDGSSAIDTRNVIDTAISRTSNNPGKVNTFRSDPSAPGITDDEIAGYQALAGTSHGAGVLRMLEDYPETMKNMRIESFSVTTLDTVASDGAYNVLVRLTKVETP
jgi:hypothetical protein